jgi:hypothetical protein
MERLPMRKIKDVLRLYAAGLSDRKIAVSLGVGRGSVRNYRERARDAGLSWPDVADMDDAVLEMLLFQQPFVSPPSRFGFSISRRSVSFFLSDHVAGARVRPHVPRRF